MSWNTLTPIDHFRRRTIRDFPQAERLAQTWVDAGRWEKVFILKYCENEYEVLNARMYDLRRRPYLLAATVDLDGTAFNMGFDPETQRWENGQCQAGGCEICDPVQAQQWAEFQECLDEDEYESYVADQEEEFERLTSK